MQHRAKQRKEPPLDMRELHTPAILCNVCIEERRGSMTKAAIVTLTDTESSEGLGRVVNALRVTKEFKKRATR